jgi:hypothetical protein
MLTLDEATPMDQVYRLEWESRRIAAEMAAPATRWGVMSGRLVGWAVGGLPGSGAWRSLRAGRRSGCAATAATAILFARIWHLRMASRCRAARWNERWRHCADVARRGVSDAAIRTTAGQATAD